MRFVITRVTQAAIHIDGLLHSAIGPGLLVLGAVTHGDGPAAAQRAADKILKLRTFESSDEKGKIIPWKLNICEAKLQVMVVSQFTLYADVKKKNKPDFHKAMAPQQAQKIYNVLVGSLRKKYSGEMIKEGKFGAMMKVSSTNDGPVTFIYETGDQQLE